MKPEHERALRELRAELVAKRNELARGLKSVKDEPVVGKIAALDAALAEIERARKSLENVRLLTASRRRLIDPKIREHLLRFCAEAGVVGSILRERAGRETER